MPLLPRLLILLFNGAFAVEEPVGVEQHLLFALCLWNPVDLFVPKEMHA